MATPVLDATDFPLQLSQYRCYRSQLTGLEVPLRNITTSEAAILRDALGGGSDPRVQIERQRLLDSTAADGLGNAELQERQRRLLIANQQEASRSAFGMNGTWGALSDGGSSRAAAARRSGERPRPGQGPGASAPVCPSCSTTPTPTAPSAPPRARRRAASGEASEVGAMAAKALVGSRRCRRRSV